MRADGFFANIMCVISQKSIQLAGFAFIDDINLCVTIQPEEQLTIHEKMQNAVTHWAGLLQASGGALVPEKCFWYKINFEWQKNQWQYWQPVQNKAILMVPDKHSNMVPIHA